MEKAGLDLHSLIQIVYGLNGDIEMGKQTKIAIQLASPSLSRA
jgi:hypothetical protein